MLHLKRFEMDYNTLKYYKLNDECSFPETLDMEPFTVSPIWDFKLESSFALLVGCPG